MPNFSKTHIQCKKLVIIICMRKADQELTATYIEKILKFIQKYVIFHRVPLAACIIWHFQIRKLSDSNTKIVTKLYNFDTTSI